jgi:uncharacterized protein YjiS (DUF1127 family)
MSLGHLSLTGVTETLGRPISARPLAEMARLWLRLAVERRALSGLDARLLADIGLSAETAAAEAARPFWDVPAGR